MGSSRKSVFFPLQKNHCIPFDNARASSVRECFEKRLIGDELRWDRGKIFDREADIIGSEIQSFGLGLSGWERFASFCENLCLSRIDDSRILDREVQ